MTGSAAQADDETTLVSLIGGALDGVDGGHRKGRRALLTALADLPALPDRTSTVGRR